MGGGTPCVRLLHFERKMMTKIKRPVLIMPGKCKTCVGYGLWGVGDACPMGRMDAADGCPTQECPECHANPNPLNIGPNDRANPSKPQREALSEYLED